jgi:hypothetical protein
MTFLTILSWSPQGWLKVQLQCGFSGIDKPPSSPCPYMVTKLVICWWMLVKDARVSSPKFLGELSGRELVTCLLVFLCDTFWVQPGQPSERTEPVWGPVAGATDAEVCCRGKLCLAWVFEILVQLWNCPRVSVGRTWAHQSADVGACGGPSVCLQVLGFLLLYFLFCI